MLKQACIWCPEIALSMMCVSTSRAFMNFQQLMKILLLKNLWLYSNLQYMTLSVFCNILDTGIQKPHMYL